jgi:hypothetical protein
VELDLRRPPLLSYRIKHVRLQGVLEMAAAIASTGLAANKN